MADAQQHESPADLPPYDDGVSQYAVMDGQHYKGEDSGMSAADAEREASGRGTSQERYADSVSADEDEDPLEGDVDTFVHPDETRTDEQIARDEEVEKRLHMSGADGADEYWADYDAYFGTVNGGEEPPIEESDDGDTEESQNLSETPGTPEWHAAHTQTVVDVDGVEHRYFDLGPMFEGMDKPEIAEYLRQAQLDQKAREKKQAYWDELDEQAIEGETENPLAGDIDTQHGNRL